MINAFYLIDFYWTVDIKCYLFYLSYITVDHRETPIHVAFLLYLLRSYLIKQPCSLYDYLPFSEAPWWQREAFIDEYDCTGGHNSTRMLSKNQKAPVFRDLYEEPQGATSVKLYRKLPSTTDSPWQFYWSIWKLVLKMWYVGFLPRIPIWFQ